MKNHTPSKKTSASCKENKVHFGPRRKLYLAIAAHLLALSTPAWAGPEGGVVMGGSGTIDQSGLDTTIIQNTDKLSIDWNSFDVNIDEKVTFIQPTDSSVALNRILDGDASNIFGQIDANGYVVLMNPNGIMFGKDASINVGGLIASGLAIDPNDFMNGDYALSAIEGSEGAIVNAGIINAATGGSVVLVGKSVENTGLISAKLGSVSLAAGKEAIVSFDHQGLLGVKVTQAILQNELGVNAAVQNSGDIKAEGGRILLTSSASQDIFTQAVNAGELNAKTSVVMHDDGSFTLGGGADVVNTGAIDVSSDDGVAGRIVVLGENITNEGAVLADILSNNANTTAGSIELHSADTTLLTKSSSISASATQAGIGGDVKVLGDKVGVFQQSTVKATGAEGGGSILIGGDEKGSNPLVRNAAFVNLGKESSIDASALINGHGGTVITFAEDTARIHGALSARGGAEGGDGGFIETSGLKHFEISSTPDTLATRGTSGSWLIDPSDFNIGAIIPETGFTESAGEYTSFELPDGSTANNISIPTLIAAFDTNTNIIIKTGNEEGSAPGNITFFGGSSSSIDINAGGGKSLTLDAYADIIFEDLPFSITGADLTLKSGKDIQIVNDFNTNGGNLTIDAGANVSVADDATLTTSGGIIDILADSLSARTALFDTSTGSNAQGLGTVTIETTQNAELSELAVDGNLTVTSIFGDIELPKFDTNVAGSVELIALAGSIINGGESGHTIHADNDISMIASVVATGISSFGLFTHLDAGNNITITSSSNPEVNGGLLIYGDLTAGGKATITAEAGDIKTHFSSTLDVSGDLTLNASGSIFHESILAQSNGNFISIAGNQISLNSPLNLDNGGVSLTAGDNSDINIYADITLNDADFTVLNANRFSVGASSLIDTGGGEFKTANVSEISIGESVNELATENGTVRTQGGTVSLSADTITLFGAVESGGGDFIANSDSFTIPGDVDTAGGLFSVTAVNNFIMGAAPQVRTNGGNIEITAKELLINLFADGPSNDLTWGALFSSASESNNSGDITIKADAMELPDLESSNDINLVSVNDLILETPTFSTGGSSTDLTSLYADGTINIDVTSGSITIGTDLLDTGTALNLNATGSINVNSDIALNSADFIISKSSQIDIAAGTTLSTGGGIIDITATNLLASDATFDTLTGSTQGEGHVNINTTLNTSLPGMEVDGNLNVNVGDAALILPNDDINVSGTVSYSAGSISVHTSTPGLYQTTAGIDITIDGRFVELSQPSQGINTSFTAGNNININTEDTQITLETDLIAGQEINITSAFPTGVIELKSGQLVAGTKLEFKNALQLIVDSDISLRNSDFIVSNVNFLTMSSRIDTGGGIIDILVGNLDAAQAIFDTSSESPGAEGHVTINTTTDALLPSLNVDGNLTVTASSITASDVSASNLTLTSSGNIDQTGAWVITNNTSVNFTEADAAATLFNAGNDFNTFTANTTLAGNSIELLESNSITLDDITGFESVRVISPDTTVDGSISGTASIQTILTLDGTTAADQMTITSNASFQNIGSFWVNFYTGDDTFNVSASTPSDMLILGNEGDDTFNILEDNLTLGLFNGGADNDTFNSGALALSENILGQGFAGNTTYETSNIETYVSDFGGNDRLIGVDGVDAEWEILNNGNVIVSGTDLEGKNFLNLFTQKTLLTGASGSDSFIYVNDSNTIENIIGGGGNDSLSLANSSADLTWELANTGENVVQGITTFTEIESIIGSAGSDLFLIDTPDAIISIDGQGSRNTIEIVRVAPSTTTWNITGVDQGTLNQNDEAQISFLNVANLSGGNDADNFTFTDTGALTGLANGGAGNDTLSMAGNTNDYVWIVDTDNGGSVSFASNNLGFSDIENIVGGDADDVFTLSANIATINGGLGNNSLQGSDTNNNWIVSSITTGSLQLENNLSATAFSNVKDLIGGSGDDTLTSTLNGPNIYWAFGSSSQGSVSGVDVDAQGNITNGVNLVNVSNFENLVGSSSNDIFNYSALLKTIEGGGGINTLRANGNTDSTWDISANNSGSINTLSFSNIQDLEGGTGVDTINIADGVSIGNITTLAGNDVITFGTGASAQSLLTGAGDDTVTLGDFVTITGLLDGGADTDTLDISAFTSAIEVNFLDGSTNSGLLTTGFEAQIVPVTGTTLFGGDLRTDWLFQNDDTIVVTAYNADDSIAKTDTLNTNYQKLRGGSGINNFVLASSQNFDGEIEGEASGSNTLSGSDLINRWIIDGQDSGSVQEDGGSVSTLFSNIQTLIGGSNSDRFELIASGSVTGSIDGNAGTDTLLNMRDNESHSWTLGDSTPDQLIIDTDATLLTRFAGIENLIASETSTGNYFSIQGGATDVNSIIGGGDFTNLNSNTSGTVVNLQDQTIQYDDTSNASTHQINVQNITAITQRNTTNTGTLVIGQGIDNQWRMIDGQVFVESASGTDIGLSGFASYQGGSATDTILSDPDDANIKTWTIDSDNAATVGYRVQSWNFTNIESIIGSDSDDIFEVSAQIDNISGGGGVNGIAAYDLAEDQVWQLNAVDSSITSTNLEINFNGIQQVYAQGIGNNVSFYLNDLTSDVVSIGTALTTLSSLSFANLAQPFVLDLNSIGREFTWIDTYQGNGQDSTLIGDNSNRSWNYSNTDGSLMTEGVEQRIVFTDFGSITAGSGVDTLVALGDSSSWDITGINSGSLNGTFNFSGIEIAQGDIGADTFTFSDNSGIDQVFGYGGDDTFVFANNVSVNLLDGGDGNDTLDIGSLNSIIDYLGVVSVDQQDIPTANIENTISGTGTGSLTLFGGDAGSSWLINADGSININVSGVDYSFDQASGISGVLGGAGDDSFVLAEGASLVNGIAGGSADNDSLTFQGTGDAQWVIDTQDGGNLSSNGVTTSFSEIATLIGGGGNDSFDVIDEGSLTGTLDGGLGLNDSIINNRDERIDDTGNVDGWRLAESDNSNYLRRGLENTVSFSGIETVIGNPGAGYDIFYFGTGTTDVINIDGGIDSISRKGGAISSLNSAFVDLQSNSFSYIKENGTLAESITFSNIRIFNTNRSTLDNIGTFSAASASNTWSVNTETGSGILVSNGEIIRFEGFNLFNGGNGDDSFNNSNSGNDLNINWNIDSDYSGSFSDNTNTYSFTNFENLIGGDSDDTFNISAQINSISGGGGVNRIETSLAEDQVWQLNTNDGSISSTSIELNFDGIQQVYAQGVGNNVSFYLNDLTSDVVSIGSELTTLSTLSFANLTQPFVLDLNNIGREVVGIDTYQGNGQGSTLLGDNSNRRWGYSITDGSLVTGSGGQGIAFTDFESFTAGTGVDTLVALGDSSLWDITGNNSGTLDGTFAFSGVETIEGSAGDDTFTFSDNASIDQVLGLGGDDTFVFANNVSVNLLDGGDGNDTLDIGNLNSIIDYLGVVSVDQQDIPTANIENTISGTGTGSLTLFGGDTDSAWLIGADGRVTITKAGVDYNFDNNSNITAVLGGLGNDDFVLAEGAGLSGGITGGSTANDSLTVQGTSDVQWLINAQDGGNLSSNGITTSFAQIANLIGSGGADQFEILAGGSVTGSIDGGLGSDTLTANNGVQNNWSLGEDSVNNLDKLRSGNVLALFKGIESLVGISDQVDIFELFSSTTDVLNISGGALDIAQDGVYSTEPLLVNLAESYLTYEINSNTQSNPITLLNINSFKSDASSTLIAPNTNNLWLINEPISVDSAESITLISDEIRTDFYSDFQIQGGSAFDTITGYISSSELVWTVDSNSNTSVTADGRTYNFTNIENLIGSDSDDTFNIYSSDIQSIDGGAGNNTLAGGDQINTWDITENFGGSFNNTNFANIQNLVGGSQQDTVYIFQNMSIGDIDTGAGDDFVTLDSGAGAQNILVADGTDIVTLLDAVNISGLIDGGAGIDTLDLGAFGSAIELDFLSGNSTSGLISQNFESEIPPPDGSAIFGGDLDTDWEFLSGSSIKITAYNADGSVFKTDTITAPYSLLRSGSGDNHFILASDENYDANIQASATANNTLTGSDLINNWLIDGVNTGRVQENSGSTSTVFSNIANIIGGGSNDQFVIAQGGGITGSLVGGAGSDTLSITADAINNWVLDAQNSVGLVNQFSGIESVVGNANDDSFTFTGNSDVIDFDGAAGNNLLNWNNDAIVLNLTDNSLNSGAIRFANINDFRANASTDNSVQGNNEDNTWVLSSLDSGTITDTSNTSTLFSGFNNLLGGSGQNTLTGPDVALTWAIVDQDQGSLTSASAETQFTNMQSLIGGSDNDLFVMKGLNADITNGIIGGGGINSLEGFDQRKNTFIVNGVYQGSLNGGMTYSQINHLQGGDQGDLFQITASSMVDNVSGGAGDDRFDIGTDAIAQTLTGSAGNDTFVIGNRASVVLVDGGTNTIEDILDLSAVEGAVIVDFLNRPTNASIDSINIENIIVGSDSSYDGGDGNNRWLINGDGSGILTKLDGEFAGDYTFNNMVNLLGGNGTDEFILSGNGNVLGYIDGGADDNSLAAKDTINAWLIDGVNQGTLRSDDGSGAIFRNIAQLIGSDSNIDTFTLASGGSIVNISAGSQSVGNRLIVDQSLSANWSLGNTNNQLTIANQTVSFNGINLIDGSLGDDVVQLLSTDTSVNAFNGRTGANAFDLNGLNSSAVVDLQQKTAAGLSISGFETFAADASLANQLIGLDEQATWSLGGNNIGSITYQNGSTTITYSGFTSVQGGSGADSFVLATANTPHSIDGGLGTDTLSTANTDNTWVLNGSGGSLNGQDFESIETINAGNGDNSFTLASAQVSTNITTGSGDNTLIGFDADTNWVINADGTGTVNDQLAINGIRTYIGGGADDTFTVAANTALNAIRGGAGNDTFKIGADVSVTRLDGDAGDDTFEISPTLSVIGDVDGGTGSNTINLQQYQVATAGFDIAALVGFSFINFDTVLEPRNPGTYFGGNDTNIWYITGEDEGRLQIVDGSNAGTYVFSGIHTLLGGTGKDTFIFETDQAAITNQIVGGEGDSNNTLDLSATNLINQWLIDGANDGLVSNSANTEGNVFINIAYLIGGSNRDTLRSNTAGDSTWRIAGIDQGTLEIANKLANFTGMENLEGGLGNDSFLFSTAGQISGSIDGSTGLDSLSHQGENNQWLVNTDGNAVSGTLLDGDANTSLSFIRIEALNAAGDNDQLIASNQGNNTWSVGDSAQNSYINLNNDADLQVTFDGMEQLLGGAGNDAFTIINAASIPTSIDGGLGNDSVDTRGINQDLTIALDDSAQGASATRLQLANINALTANANRRHQLVGASDQGYSWVIDSLNSGTVSPSNANNSIESLRFNNVSAVIGGANDDIFQVLATTDISLDGGDALTADFVDYSQVNANLSINLADSLNGSNGVVTGVEGIRGNHSGPNSINTAELIGSNTNNVWTIADFDGAGIADGINDGQFTNGSKTVSFIDFNVLTGGASSDTFNQTSGVIEGRIDGGAGNDTLNITLASDSASALNNRGTLFVGGADNDTLNIRGGGSDLTAVYTASVNGGTFTYNELDHNYLVSHGTVEFVNELSRATTLEVQGSSAGDVLALADNSFAFNQLAAVNHNKENLVIRTDTNDRVEIVENILLAGSLRIINGSLVTNDSANTSITANELALERTQNVGSSSNRIRTSINNLVIADTLGDIYLQEQNGLNIADFTPAAGTFDVNLLRGDLTSTAALESNNRFSAAALDGNITLNQQNNLAGDLTLNATDTVTLNSDVTVKLAGVRADTLILQSRQDITQTGPVVVSEYTYLEAGNDIVLDNNQNDFNRISIVAAGDATIVDQNALQLFGVDVNGHLKIKSAGLNIDNAVTANTLELDGGTGSVVMKNGSTVKAEGRIDVKSDDDIIVTIIQGNGIVNVESSGGSLKDGNGAESNITADTLIVKVNNGIGATDAIETTVKKVNVNTNTGDVEIDNQGQTTLENVTTTNGNINFTNNGTIELEPQSVKAAGTNKGQVAIGSSTGDIRQSGNSKEPAIVAENVVLDAPNGSFGQGGFNIDANRVTVKAQRQIGELITPPGTTRDAQFSGTFKFEDQLLVVDQFEDVSPAVFSNVKGYFYNDVSLKLSADQLYDEEEEDED